MSALAPPGIERWPVTDRASWLARRQADVTASAIAALLGEHPYLTAYALWAQKAQGLRDEEAEPRVEPNSVSLPPLIRGTVLEVIAPRVLAYLRPAWAVEPAGVYYRDPAARIGATPDFFAADPDQPGFGVVQVKTCDQLTLRRSWMDDGAIRPPLYAAIQAVVEARLTGASWAVVAVLVSGHTLDLHLIDVPLHAGLWDRLVAEVAHFWRLVEAGTAPDPDYARDGALIERLFRPEPASTIDLSADNELPALLDERESLSAGKGAAEKRLREIKARLVEKLDQHEAGLAADGRTITAKTITRAPYAVEATSFVDLRVKAAKPIRSAA